MSGIRGRSRARVARAKDKLRRGWGHTRLACAGREPALPAAGPLPKCLLEPPENPTFEPSATPLQEPPVQEAALQESVVPQPTLPEPPIAEPPLPEPAAAELADSGPDMPVSELSLPELVAPEPDAPEPDAPETATPQAAARADASTPRRRFLQLSAGAGLALAGGFAAYLARPLDQPPPKQPVVSKSIDLPLSETAYLEAPLPRHKPEDPPLGPLLSDRKLALYNENTGETVRATFWAGGDYVLEELESIQWLLRDHHVDEMRAIDLKLLDVMFALQTKLEADEPLHILSAYRTERTNAKLRGIYDGVALNSFHIKGQAVDVRLPGRRKRELYRAARALKAGGVGSYRGYIHIDTGPIRAW